MAESTYRVLGIDLGGCMGGNSAYVFAEVSERGMHVIEALKEPKHRDHLTCESFLLGMLERHRVDAIAVDAPLSLPRPLYDPAFDGPQREGSGEILNPYLFRYTDYWLCKTYGLKPMPPAGDRIGRLTARMVALLQKLDYRFPEITVANRRIPIYEVYPKQVAQSLGVRDYKQKRAEVTKQLGADLQTEDEHLLDALLCCYAGAKVLGGKGLLPPAGIEAEGWCFPV